jgi:methanogenic corrinoid protein MtbC1
MVRASDMYAEYLASLLDGRREACRRIVQKLLDAETPVRDIYVSLFQRSMYEVGRLWETGRISVATEHLATGITESLMTIVYPLIFAAEHVGRSAVVSCAADEFHQIGGKMVADTMELNGWDAYFLGANTPLDDLQDLIAQKRPELVALSLSVYFNMPALRRAVEAIGEAFPAQRIIVGGQAFRWAGPRAAEQLSGAEYVPSLEQLERILGASQDDRTR